MRIHFHKKFQKMYHKLEKRKKESVDAAIRLFSLDPFHKDLRNHKLKGNNRKDARSIDAAFDLRILYREEGGHAVIMFLEVGTHSELYG